MVNDEVLIMMCGLIANSSVIPNEAIIECVNNGSSMLDIVAIVVALLSLVITTIISIISYKSNQKISRINISADYFNDIYKEILINQIPCARANLYWSEDGALQNHSDLCDKIVSLKDKSLYYKFTKPNYYKKLCACVEKAEDSICGTSNRKLDILGREQALKNIENLIQELYVCVNRGLNGEDFK